MKGILLGVAIGYAIAVFVPPSKLMGRGGPAA